MTTDSADQWRALQAMLDQALDLPQSERESHVQSLRDVDDAMRAELLRLVRAAAESDDFLSRPVVELVEPFVEPLAAQPVALADGELVGPYRTLRELGRGGMGSVYLAERMDDPTGPCVAIKILPPDLQTDRSLRRFHEEQHILASMEHPAIARLLDGGVSDRALPYFVMEYVNGVPIDVYCDEHRLTIGDRLRLLGEVCSAVHYAHQKQVIHRDIKPSNILVTSDGHMRLLDFGIAKLLSPEGSNLTSTTTRVMTPEYASPEQVLGAMVGPASDVYSLGVLLYRLLAGRSPYRLIVKSNRQLVRAILRDEPSPPSRAVAREAEASQDIADRRSTTLTELSHALEGDLDAICLRALHKKPEQRYPSVEQMAADIRRHLEGLPIASLRSRVSALARWRRRHS